MARYNYIGDDRIQPDNSVQKAIQELDTLASKTDVDMNSAHEKIRRLEEVVKDLIETNKTQYDMIETLIKKFRDPMDVLRAKTSSFSLLETEPKDDS